MLCSFLDAIKFFIAIVDGAGLLTTCEKKLKSDQEKIKLLSCLYVAKGASKSIRRIEGEVRKKKKTYIFFIENLPKMELLYVKYLQLLFMLTLYVDTS